MFLTKGVLAIVEGWPAERQVIFWRNQRKVSGFTFASCLALSFYVATSMGDGGKLDVHKQVEPVIQQAKVQNPKVDVASLRDHLNAKADFYENSLLVVCAGFTGLSGFMLRKRTKLLNEAEQKLRPD